MPVLRGSNDRSGLVIEAAEQGAEVLYRLSEEGERFLSLVLGLHAGDSVRDKDLTLLIDRGWVSRIEPPSPEPAPSPTPAPPPRPTPPAARVAATRRTRGREVALQVLYLIEQNPEVEADEVDRFLVRRLRDPRLVEYTRELVDGVRSHLAQIDDRIASVAENWRLDRMAAIDRNILRLGVYEMHHRPDVPVKVAINEALELAKRYSTAQSSRFVNGILDRLQSAPDSTEPVEPPPSGADWVEPAAPDSNERGDAPSRPAPPAGAPPLASRGAARRAASRGVPPPFTEEPTREGDDPAPGPADDPADR